MIKQLTINNFQFSSFRKRGLALSKQRKLHGFTLVELLIVIAVLGVLVTIGLVSFASAQARGRDTQRKSNLKQIANSLELYYSDHGRYPESINGQIAGCPSTGPTACVWGTDGTSSEFTDGRTVYFKVLPKDPSRNGNYYYRIVDSVTGQKFQIFAHLENTQDPDLITTSYSCGTTGTCNFALTSPNVTPTE